MTENATREVNEDLGENGRERLREWGEKGRERERE